MKNTIINELTFINNKNEVAGSFELKAGLNFFWGKNGSGKTAIFKGFLYALGNDVELPDIYKKIKVVIITVIKKGEQFQIRRFINSGNYSICNLNENKNFEEIYVFSNSNDYSDWFFNFFQIERKEITHIRRKTSTQLFTSSITPLFCIDQDFGWHTLYHSFGKGQFITDQYEEAMRGLLTLPSKRPFDSSQELKELESRSVTTKRLKTIAKAEIKALESTLKKDISLGKNHFIDQVSQIQDQLNQFKTGISSSRAITEPFDIKINELTKKINLSNSEIRIYDKEINQYERLISGIDDEISLLNDNDSSIESLRGFCSSIVNGQCGLFSNTKESYSKRLYYLRDQVKDFQLVIGELSDEKRATETHLNNFINDVDRLKDERAVALKGSTDEQMLNSISDLSRKLLSSESALAKIYKHKSLSEAVKNYEEELESLVILIEQTKKKSKGLDSEDFTNFLIDFQKQLNEWLDILGTTNIAKPIDFTKDLSINFADGTKFTDSSQESGSTRTRIILSFVASTIQKLSSISNSISFSWLDTPRQQEIEVEDLKLYLQRLSEISTASGMPIIINITDLPDNIPQSNTFEPEVIQNGNKYYLKV